MKVLVVDDEPLARERLVQILSGLELGITPLLATNGLRAVEMCQSEKPDVVLMDIRMPGMDGLEAAEHICQLDSSPAIIFVTAYDEYALDAFKVHAIDYLLKPVRAEKLKEALQRASRISQVQMNGIRVPSAVRTNITAKISGNIKLIPIEDVLYFQAEQKYVTVKHLHGETIIEDTLKELQEEFGDAFVRIHRNALVATRFITGIHKTNDGKSYVTLQQGSKSLEISRRHLSEVKRLVTSL